MLGALAVDVNVFQLVVIQAADINACIDIVIYTAFALFVSVFEAIAWAIFNVAAGQLGEVYGLKPVFFAVLVVLMLINTAFITLIYKPYAHDVQTLQDQMAARRQELLSEGAAD